MRVLDVDLDFFLADTCPLAGYGCRPALQGHEPWSESEVRAFLEEKLRLSRLSPVEGRIYETHDGSLRMWDELVRAGRLSVPFEVTHIDAHSDLGIGYPGPGLVMNNALCRKPDARVNLEDYYRLKQLDEANYLLFALAFRWVSLLENVRNPNSKPDMPREIVHERDERSVPTALRLAPPLPSLFEAMNGKEPVVKYREFASGDDYVSTSGFDFISLAMSPRYAPREADCIADVIAEYIKPI